MDFEFNYFGSIENGQLKFNRKGLEKDIALIEKATCEIIVRKKRSRRSGEQNRYFHAICGILGKELGYEKEQMKDILKMKFLKKERVIEATGEIIEYLEHTSRLNKTEFADFTSEVIRWAEQLGIILPLPEEQTTLNIQ